MDQPNKCCSRCGVPIRASSKYGVCTRNPDCRRENGRRRWAAHPGRQQRATEKALSRAAERARMAERILELRKQGWSRRAIGSELHVGTPFVAEVTKDIPGKICQICGSPRRAGGTSPICTQNPDCARARAAFAVRFRVNREGYPTNLTMEYLLSIWSGRCNRQDCGKVLAAPGGPRKDVASLDRIFPARGYMQGNVQWLCGRCNRQKQDMTSVEMRAMLADQLRAEMQVRDWDERKQHGDL